MTRLKIHFPKCFILITFVLRMSSRAESRGLVFWHEDTLGQPVSSSGLIADQDVSRTAWVVDSARMLSGIEGCNKKRMQKGFSTALELTAILSFRTGAERSRSTMRNPKVMDARFHGHDKEEKDKIDSRPCLTTGRCAGMT